MSISFITITQLPLEAVDLWELLYLLPLVEVEEVEEIVIDLLPL